MSTVILKSMLATLLLTASCATLADDGRGGGKPQVFAGVFYPAFSAWPMYDPERCPATHPILFQFLGDSYTTLGYAAIAQSHCEDEGHTSFVRGKQTITTGNDDRLYGTYEGKILPTPTTGSDGALVVRGHYRNAGGTGAFSKANGKGVTVGTVNLFTGAVVIAVTGDL
jgi:hypothetical protein